MLIKDEKMKSWRVLCVDDDVEKAEQVAEFFTEWRNDNPIGDFEAFTESSFAEAKKRLAQERFDLVILDLHERTDPSPDLQSQEGASQQGRLVLDDLKKNRFLPVIFYSGYADKILNLNSPVVRVVKKGDNDLQNVRQAATVLFSTKLPELMRLIEDTQRSYVWDTVDQNSKDFSSIRPEELVYLVARRIAARLNRDAIKECLGELPDKAHPMEVYIYPAIAARIKTGYVYGPDEAGAWWIVATPACDFEQGKAEHVLRVGARRLTDHPIYKDWHSHRSLRQGDAKATSKEREAHDKLMRLLRNNAGDRFRFLPGTFFLPDIVVDLQSLRQLPAADLDGENVVCCLDSPYREEMLLHLSKYYGRIGTPDLDMGMLFRRLAAQ